MFFEDLARLSEKGGQPRHAEIYQECAEMAKQVSHIKLKLWSYINILIIIISITGICDVCDRQSFIRPTTSLVNHKEIIIKYRVIQRDCIL